MTSTYDGIPDDGKCHLRVNVVTPDGRDELAIMFCGRAFSACDKRSTRASKAYSAFHGL